MPSKKKSPWGATINTLSELEPLVPKDLRSKVVKRLTTLTGGDVIQYFEEEFRLRCRRGIQPMVAREYVENLLPKTDLYPMDEPPNTGPRSNLWE